jgi:hypothetical protein
LDIEGLRKGSKEVIRLRAGHDLPATISHRTTDSPWVRPSHENKLAARPLFTPERTQGERPNTSASSQKGDKSGAVPAQFVERVRSYPRKYFGIHDAKPGNRMTSTITIVSASMNHQTWRFVSAKVVLAMLVVTNRSGAVGGETAPI